MRRATFVVVVILMFCATVALTLAASKALGIEPRNPADAPQPLPTTAELVQASVRGCMEGLGLAEVGIAEGVALVRCRANLGVHKP